MVHLNIPIGARCLIPGCKNTPTHIFSFRMRRQDSGASWAPNLPAYFCDDHANNGADINIEYEANNTNVINTQIIGTKHGQPASRRYDLKNKRGT